MIGCQEINYILIGVLIVGAYMFKRQRDQLLNSSSEESALVKKAYFDSLTSLPNKENINIILDEQIYRCQRRDISFLTAVVKVDNTKDKVIIETASRLFKSIRKEDIVGYISEGIFVIVFNEYLEESKSSIIFDRIDKSFEEEFLSNGETINISIEKQIKRYPNEKTIKELTSFL